MQGLIMFILFLAAAICAGIVAWTTRSLMALAVTLIAAGLVVWTWPGV